MSVQAFAYDGLRQHLNLKHLVSSAHTMTDPEAVDRHHHEHHDAGGEDCVHEHAPALPPTRLARVSPPTGSASFITVEEIAHDLALHRMTVYRLIHQGTIPASRIGRSFRILRSDYQKFLNGAIVNQVDKDD